MAKLRINRYEHGGARVMLEDHAGRQDLVVDIYEPEDRREAIIAALIEAGIIPPDDLPRAVRPFVRDKPSMPLWKRWLWTIIGFVILSPLVMIAMGYVLEQFVK